MKQRVNANRMNLMRLRNRLEKAKRGHFLLKQKLEELQHVYQSEYKKYVSLQNEIFSKINLMYEFFIVGSAFLRGEALKYLTTIPVLQVTLQEQEEKLFNIKMSSYEANIHMEKPPLGGIDINSDFYEAIRKLNELLPDLIRLGEIIEHLNQIEEQLKTTRRRVNSLEYVLIPDIEKQIKYINLKLDENERSAINRLMRLTSTIKKEK